MTRHLRLALWLVGGLVPGSSDAGSRVHVPLRDRVEQCAVVTLVLVRVGPGEVDEGTVESAGRTQVARDRDAVPGPGVGPGEGPPAEVGVRGETARHHLLDLERPLPVAELSDVEVALGGVDPGDSHPA